MNHITGMEYRANGLLRLMEEKKELMVIVGEGREDGVGDGWEQAHVIRACARCQDIYIDAHL